MGAGSFPVLAILGSALIALTSAHAAEVRIDAKVFIEVQKDGKQCAIRKARILCADAIAHLREVLKLEPGAPVGVKAHQAAPFKEVRKVLEYIQKSEFVIPVAYVLAPKDQQK